MADSKFFRFVFLVEELRLCSEDTTGEVFWVVLNILRSDAAPAASSV